MPKKYYERKDVIADAAEIVRRLRETDVTQGNLRREYKCGHALMMEVILSQMTKHEWVRIRKNKLRRGNIAHHFKRGHMPWNKGRKGIHPSPATEFKKGHLPTNHKHVGTIRMVTRERNRRINQFREIKVSGIMQGKHKWILYARYLYEQKYGPIPKDHFVVHVNGDSMNDDLDNLRIVDRKGHLALQMQRDPNMLKKCKRNAAKALRKRWTVYRRRKAKLLKISQKTRERVRRTEREESQYKAELEKEIKNIKGVYTVWWECTGCGFEAVNDPPLPCPKCGGLRYEQIRQNRKPTRAVSIGLTSSAAAITCS